jgi:hypothetical protein
MSETAERRSMEEQKEELRESTPGGLSFLALLSFVTSFVAARAFASLNPSAVVVSGGIHFHHFWYGLILVIAAGFAGIIYGLPAYKRIYIVVFGLGTGLVGDEVGLLLTFGDYNSSLTFFFFVIVVTCGSMAVLLIDRKQVENDVIGLAAHERTLLTGIVIMGLSALAFAANLNLLGAVIAAAGLALTLLGVMWRRAKRRKRLAMNPKNLLANPVEGLYLDGDSLGSLRIAWRRLR